MVDPEAFCQYSLQNTVGLTHSWALCISSSVADMKSVLEGQLTICGIVRDVPSQNQKLQYQQELMPGLGYSHMEAGAGIS